jgi:hypothetical protein
MKIAIAVLLAAVATLAYAQIGLGPPPSGRYLVVATQDGAAWRIDTATGSLSKCTGTSAEVRCSNPNALLR